jgi:hypothetical protein
MSEQSFRNGNGAGLFEERWKSNMLNKLLAAAAMAAVLYSTSSASAAKIAGCSSENLSKTKSMIDAMPDSQGKFMAQNEVAMAQTAMLDGKMGVCAVPLTRAMRAGMMR